MIIQDMKQRITNNSRWAFFFYNEELFFQLKWEHDT